MIAEIAAYLAIGISLGILLTRKVDQFAFNDFRKRRNATLKNRKDMLNWLKSELSTASRRKLAKTVDAPRVELLEKIIKKMEKWEI